MEEERVVKFLNPRLRGALNALAVENSESKKMAVLEEIVASRFLCPFTSDKPPVRDENGTISFPKDSKLRPVVEMDRNGETHMLAFTDEDTLNKWKSVRGMKESYSFVFSVMDYADTMLNLYSTGEEKRPNGFIINCLEEGLLVDQDMIANVITRMNLNRK